MPTGSTTPSSSSSKRRRLNQNQGSQSLWLVRLPAELADLWSNSQNNEILGQAAIKMISSDNGPASRQLEVTLPDNRVFVVEDQHSASVKVDSTSFFAFSEHEHRREKSFSLQGRVSKRCVLRAKDPNSRRGGQQAIGSSILGQNRLISTQEIRERQTQQQQPQIILQEDTFTVSVLPSSLQTVGLVALTENEVALIETELIAAFESAASLSIAELLARAKRRVPGVTDALLRPLVKRLADYRQSGTKKGLWELKPEFRSLSINSTNASG